MHRKNQAQSQNTHEKRMCAHTMTMRKNICSCCKHHRLEPPRPCPSSRPRPPDGSWLMPPSARLRLGMAWLYPCQCVRTYARAFPSHHAMHCGRHNRLDLRNQNTHNCWLVSLRGNDVTWKERPVHMLHSSILRSPVLERFNNHDS